eukprot:7263278-Pyramimonas_sp.AAC.1
MILRAVRKPIPVDSLLSCTHPLLAPALRFSGVLLTHATPASTSKQGRNSCASPPVTKFTAECC